MSEHCDHSCHVHFPDDGDPDTVWVRVPTAHPSLTLPQIEAQIDWYDPEERWRIVQWLADEYLEGPDAAR